MNGCKKEETNTSPPRRLSRRCFARLIALFTLLPHHLSLSDSIKETGNQTRIRWFFGDTSPPSSRSAGFPNKVILLASKKKCKQFLFNSQSPSQAQKHWGSNNDSMAANRHKKTTSCNMPWDKANNWRKEAIYSPQFLSTDLVNILCIFFELNVNTVHETQQTQQEKLNSRE